MLLVGKPENFRYLTQNIEWHIQVWVHVVSYLDLVVRLERAG